LNFAGFWCRIVKEAVKGGNVSDALRARVETALDRLEAAEYDLAQAARRVTEARSVLRTAFREEREERESCACGMGEPGSCQC
jgi:hypothetical protein